MQKLGDAPEIWWNCPECGARNVDLPAETAIPMCGSCQRDVNWWDIPGTARIRKALLERLRYQAAAR